MDISGKISTRRRRRHECAPDCERLDDRCLLSGLSPAQVISAYGLAAISFTAPDGTTVKGDGAGETIALIEAYHDPTLASDLQAFDQTYKLPNSTLTVDDLAGKAIDQGWGLEESLDVEWAHAIAPSANILVVEASAPTLQGLVTAVNMARGTPGVVAVSMSWGFSEFRQETAYNDIFTTPGGSSGITFLASSGDSGYEGGPEWPSVAPTVLAVGGTTLYLDGSGSYLSETAWNGSSGGYSHFEAEPEYQREVQTTGKRSSPDVSFDGDPNTGVSVYQTSPLTGQGSWYVVGGTSVGAPAWAGIIAIADQGRALAGKGNLDGPTQALPTIYALAANMLTSVSPIRRVKHSAKATANTATGLGSPLGQNLITGLVASDVSIALTTNASPAGVARKQAHTKTVHKVAPKVRARPNVIVLASKADKHPTHDL
jgi:hypothetical protein